MGKNRLKDVIKPLHERDFSLKQNITKFTRQDPNQEFFMALLSYTN